MKIRKGDTVRVITGKHRGKQGVVDLLLTKQNRIIVKGVNIITKHKKDTGDKTKASGRIQVEAPIDISNVMLMCPHTGKPTRVGFKIDPKTKQKQRISKKSGKII